MKKFIGLLAIMFCLTVTVNAQKLKADKVPAAVKSSFTKLHPGVSAKWEMEDKNYEVGFTSKGQETTEVYTANGSLIETEVATKLSELPAAVQAKLKGMKVTETAKITKANGTVIYEAEVKGKDLLFDANGTVIKP